MKILILSDTHSLQKEKLLQFIEGINPDHTIHCGDIYARYNIHDIPNSTVVRGNNDALVNPLDAYITLDDTTFYVCHGHRHNVPFTYDDLIVSGHGHQANIVCYGHSHEADYKFINNLTILNPGSLIYPRGKLSFGTYCLYDTKTKKTTFYNSDTHKTCTIN